MKLEPDKVRNILTILEDEPPPHRSDTRTAESDQARIRSFGLDLAELSEYTTLLGEARLIESDVHYAFDYEMGRLAGRIHVPMRLTWEGHQYLAAVKSEKIYAKTKEIASSAFGTVTMETIKAAIPLAMQVLLKAHNLG